MTAQESHDTVSNSPRHEKSDGEQQARPVRRVANAAPGSDASGYAPHGCF